MFTLKEYQKQTLSTLQDFLFQVKFRTPAEAFKHTVKALPREKCSYEYRTRWDLEDVPYVCLKLPTGGGKTLLAAHAVQIAAENYLSRDFPFVLWLVPTDKIRKQTVQALNKPSHPYNETLIAAFGLQNVCVIDIEDITNLRPKDIFDKTCIVVSTSQSFRLSEEIKGKYGVYKHNENFEPHFKSLPNQAEGLDRDSYGNVLYSFINIAHQLEPLIIVDEAHKMTSNLSGEVIKRLNPSCVIEFTATPLESNVLYRVSPSELKAEEMVKLPFCLTEHSSWENAVLESIGTRTKLEQFASQDAEAYIRPLVLFQAEKINQECTVEVLKSFLIENGIAESEIAIATGEQRELDNVDLFDKTCAIKYIITIEALKEGWDCSFAYVFCSVANVKSATDIEQLLGRVMRMPYAKARKQEELNMAYAHVRSPNFSDAASSMYDHMINMGFDSAEAATNIAPRQGFLDGLSPDDSWKNSPLGQFAEPKSAPLLEIVLTKKPDFTHISSEDVQHITIEEKDGKYLLKAEKMLSADVEESVVAVVNKAQKEEVKKQVALHREEVKRARPKSLSQQNIPFAVPRMLVEVWGSLEWAEPETILQGINWSPLDFIQAGKHPIDSLLFNYDPNSKEYIFDLEGEKLVYKRGMAQKQHTLYALPENWTELRLSRWLDSKCRQDDVEQAKMLEFCRRCVQGLLEREGIDIETLYRAKDALATIIKNKIAQLRIDAQKKGFQQLLFAPTAHVEISFEEAFNFPISGYAETISEYSGPYQFKKHYYPLPRDLKSNGEEFRCAQAIDNHPKVKMWVRNVDRQAHSFFLPTSTDKFYPDFVVILNDDRIVLVEYKGGHILSTDDTKEKRNIGELWASKSNGKGIFMLVSESDTSLSFEGQLGKV